VTLPLYFVEDSSQVPHRDGYHDTDGDLDNSTMPSVVVYIVDPFQFTATPGDLMCPVTNTATDQEQPSNAIPNQNWEELPRIAMFGLLRCYYEILKQLPEHLRNHVHLQVCSR
jgi:hypothetical protein